MAWPRGATEVSCSRSTTTAREDKCSLREMDEVEADYAGCLVRGSAASTASARSIAEILRGTTATVRTTSSTTGMMTEVGSGRRASPEIVYRRR